MRMMPDLAPGTIIAGYQIETFVGRVGMGVVYRARQLALDRTVALKLVAPELARDNAFRHRFERESLRRPNRTHRSPRARAV
jgi:serine/threonine protein kinase